MQKKEMCSLRNKPADKKCLRTMPSLANEGRVKYWDREYTHASNTFKELYRAEPSAWWLALEALRSLRNEISSCQGRLLGDTATILFSPDYAGNSYQRNLYSEQSIFNYQVEAVDQLCINAKLAHLSLSDRSVFHQHWLKELYWRAKDRTTGIRAIDYHIGILKSLRAFGVSILWTLHNLIDHDATCLQAELCTYALKEMAKVSDTIFIHTEMAGVQLSKFCNLNLSVKFKLIPHPLYDNLLEKILPRPPIELDINKIAGCRLLVAVGMIRPYKGIPDLIAAFQRLSQRIQDHGLHIVIAGHCSDPDVYKALERLDNLARSQISFVPRVLSQEEMAALMRLAAASITPYRKILTSGSFYLATTFKKPTIAPNRGMFRETIRDNETGYIYDGTVENLVATLEKISKLPTSNLIRTGLQAYNENKIWTVSAVSNLYFNQLESRN